MHWCRSDLRAGLGSQANSGADRAQGRLGDAGHSPEADMNCQVGRAGSLEDDPTEKSAGGRIQRLWKTAFLEEPSIQCLVCRSRIVM